MSLELRSIRFRGAGQDHWTLPIRKNAETPMPQGPECVRPNGEGTQSFPVAFLLNQTPGVEIVIEVGFNADLPGTYSVQAVGLQENVIRGVASFGLTAAAPGSLSLTVPVTAPLLTDAGQSQVCKHLDRLKWTATDAQGNVVLSVETVHPVYTVLSEPQAPWDSSAPETAAWTDALDIACKWASGMRDHESTATAITRNVFAIGAQNANPQFTYSSNSSYVQPTETDPVYGLIDFIETLTEAQALGRRTLNCIDTACAVTTFSNLLGCSLAQGQIFPGQTQPITLIGQTATGSQTFGFHEIAWRGTGLEQDLIWDACLSLHPGTASVSPVGLPFNDGTSSAYLPRFEAHMPAIPNVNGGIAVQNNRKLARIRSSQTLPLPGAVNTLTNLLPGAVECRRILWREKTRGYSFTYRPNPESLAWVEITIERAAAQQAAAMLEKIKRTYARPMVETMHLGSVAFTSQDRDNLLYTVGDLVVHVRNAGLVPANLDDVSSMVAGLITLAGASL
jgi:hypothetical protein